MTELDIRNGNLSHLKYFASINNPGLRCIYADDRSEIRKNRYKFRYKDANTRFVINEKECAKHTGKGKQ